MTNPSTSASSADSGPPAQDPPTPAAAGPSPGPAQTAEPTDAQLARDVAGGDAQAAQTLVLRHQGPLRGFLRKLVGKPELAEDLAQETFLRVLQACDRYDPRYPMRTWMLTIARRLAINHGQRKGNQLRLVDPQQAPPVAQTRPPDQPLIDQEQKQLARDALDEAMQSLSEPQRQAVLLFYQQGLSMEETAQAMELPVNTVKSHLHRARAALKKRLEPQQEKLR